MTDKCQNILGNQCSTEDDRDIKPVAMTAWAQGQESLNKEEQNLDILFPYHSVHFALGWT